MAGYETSATLLAFAIYELTKHEFVLKKLLQEIDLFGRDRQINKEDLT